MRKFRVAAVLAVATAALAVPVASTGVVAMGDGTPIPAHHGAVVIALDDGTPIPAHH